MRRVRRRRRDAASRRGRSTQFGKIDVVVNNAGIGDPMPAEHESLDNFRRTVAVNLTGTFALCQAAGRHMLAAGHGSIVNIASILGLVGAGQIPQTSYSPSKGAVVQLTRELAAQWARKGVRVNAIAPGWFESEMTAEMFADERSMQWVRRKTPMGRPGIEGELDGVLLFLASDASTLRHRADHRRRRGLDGGLGRLQNAFSQSRDKFGQIAPEITFSSVVDQPRRKVPIDVHLR